MRLLLCLFLAVGTATFVADEDAAPAASTAAAVTVTVWPQGKGAHKPVRRWTLRCGPAGGTHPQPRRACAALLADPALLRPLPRDVACTQVYGGPHLGQIRGTVRGSAIRASYSRGNGCEIFRWNALRAVFVVRV